MVGNSGTINIRLKMNDDGSVKLLNQVGAAADKTGKQGKQAFDDMDSSAKQMTGGIKGSTAALLKMGGAVVGLAAIGAAIKTAAVETLKMGMQFETTMKTVQAVSGATASEYAQLEAAARLMGATTEWSASQSAEALKYMSMAGMKVKDSIQALPGMLDLATAAQMDLGQATDIVTGVLAAFGMKTSELTRLSDAFINTSTRSNTTVQMLGEAFKYVAPVASMMGHSVEQTSAYLGVMANAGIKAGDAGTDLAAVMLKTSKAAETLGMDAGASLNDVLAKMHDRQLSANDVVKIFGLESGKTAMVLMKNVDAVAKLNDELVNNQGATAKTAAIMRESTKNLEANFFSAMEEIALKMYDVFEDELRDALAISTTLINDNSYTFVDWADKLSTAAELVFHGIVLGSGLTADALNALSMVWDGVKIPILSMGRVANDVFLQIAKGAKEVAAFLNMPTQSFDNVVKGLEAQQRYFKDASDSTIAHFSKLAEGGSATVKAYSSITNAAVNTEKQIELTSLKADAAVAAKLKSTQAAEKEAAREAKKGAQEAKTAAKEATAQKEQEFQDLLVFNQKKYAAEISAGEKMGADSWIVKEKGLREAMERTEDYQEKETQAAYDAEQERLKIAQDAIDQHAEDVKAANADMLDTIQGYTADIIKDWDNAGDMLVDIAKRTAAEMAAAFISQQFIMPVVQMLGSSAGLSWNGVSMSDMTGTTGTKTSGGSGGWGDYLSGAQSLYGLYTGGTSAALFSGFTSGIGSSIGTGIFGSSWLGATGSGATGALANSGLGYGGMSTIGAGSTGGIAASLANTIPIAAIIAAVETYFGSKNTESGRYSNIGENGTQIGDAWSGSFFNDPAMEWLTGKLYGTGSVHSSMAYLDAALKDGSFEDIFKSLSASIAEMTLLDPISNALLGNPISKLFGYDDPDPQVGLKPGRRGTEYDYKGEIDSPSGYDYFTWQQDTGSTEQRKQMGDLISGYFDTKFSALDDAFDWSLADVFNVSNVDAMVDPTEYNGDAQAMVDAIAKKAFTQMRAGLVEQVVAGQGAAFDMDFFEGLQTEGEDLFTTFAKFAAFGDSVENFSERINAQMGQGATAQEAFDNILAIQEVLYAVQESADGISTSSSIDTIRELIGAQDNYLTALRDASATEIELAQVQVGIAQQIGASISGLTADSLQSVLASGGDIAGILQDTVKNTAAQTIAGMASESIMEEYGNGLNELIGNAFNSIDMDTLDTDSLTAVFDGILNDFDWAGMEAESASAAAAIAEFTGAMGDSVGEIAASAEIITSIIDGIDNILIASGRLITEDIFKRDFQDKYGVVPGLEHSKEAIDFIITASQETIEALAGDFGVTVSEMLQDIANEAIMLAAALSAAQSAYDSAKSAYLYSLKSEQQALEDNAANARSEYIEGLEREQQTLEDAFKSSKTGYLDALALGSSIATHLGDKAALEAIVKQQRQLELEAMDESIRPMKERVWLLEDEAESLEKLNTAIGSVQNTIDSIMGDSSSVQSKDFMTLRYDELLADAQADPAKAQAFSNFATNYLDFISDYGDPKARENVLRDLQGIQARYLDAKEDIEEDWYLSGVTTFDLDYIRTITEKQNDYLTAQQDLQLSWYDDEILLFNVGPVTSIESLQNDYLAAKEDIQDSWFTREISMLEDANVSIEDLRKRFEDASKLLDDATGVVTNPDTPWTPGTPDDGMGDFADRYVRKLYNTIGRGPIIGTDVSQIDQGGYTYWYNEATTLGSTKYSQLFSNFKQSVTDWLEANPDDPLTAYVNSNKQFRDGGIISGSKSGYQMLDATFHGTEAIIPMNDGFIPVMMTGGFNEAIQNVEVLLTKLISISSQPDGNTQVRVYIGNKELRDLTAEVIRTDSEIQRTIRRVVNV